MDRPLYTGGAVSPGLSFLARLAGAAFLRSRVYEEAAGDRTTAAHAMAVVLLAALAQNLGNPTLAEIGGLVAIWVSILFGILRWFAFTTLVYAAARLIAARPVRYRRLLRCLGFAEAPGIAKVLVWWNHEPLVLWMASVAVCIWLLAAEVLAVRAAVPVGTRRAAVIAVVSFLIYVLIGVALMPQ